MNKELFKELEILMNKKSEYEMFLKELKRKPYINKIELSKGLYRIYFEDDLILVLIDYYEKKIEELNDKIDKFKLTKTIS